MGRDHRTQTEHRVLHGRVGQREPHWVWILSTHPPVRAAAPLALPAWAARTQFRGVSFEARIAKDISGASLTRRRRPVVWLLHINSSGRVCAPVMGGGGDSSATGPQQLTRSKIIKGLFTKEDPANIHKTFGVFALGHFIYRFRHVGPSDMNFGVSNMTLFCFAMHATLSASSLIFKIPIKRIAEGSRIWPEYRLHSIVFAYRSLACLAVTYVEKKMAVETPRYELNGLIVIATLLAADFGTWWVGPAGRSSTIQGLDAPPFMRFFFSVMQFHATAGCLLGVRRFSTQFFYVWIIQFTAFLMTLRRKNIAPHGPLVVTYGVMLTSGFLISTYDHYLYGCWLTVNTLAHLAAGLRLGLRLNKYVLWVGLAVAVHLARPHLAAKEGEDLTYRTAAWLATTGWVVAIGAKKIARDTALDAEKAKAGKAL